MSIKNVAQKLQIKPDTNFWLSDDSHVVLIQPLPDSVQRAAGPGDATVALLFADSAATLREQLEQHREHLATPSIFWIAYPKGKRADISRDSVWPIVGEYGLRPVGQVAIDDYWSALRFRPLKEGEAQFTGGKK